MELENIFEKSTLILIIPFFSALYLSFYYPDLKWACLFIALNIFIFYIIVNVWEKKIPKDQSEKQIYRTLIQRGGNFILNGIVAVGEFLLVIITLWLLRFHLNDFIAYVLFWLLITGWIFHFIRIAIRHKDVIRERFS